MSISQVEANCLDSNVKTELLELIHFIRTPLAAIKIGSVILKDYFSEFTEVNQNSHANENHEILKKLCAIVSNIEFEANRISDYIKKIDTNKYLA